MYFIIGIGRSGTSLFQSILHEYTELDVYPESQLVRRSLAFRSKMPMNSKDFLQSLSVQNPRWENIKNKLKVEDTLKIESPSDYLYACVGKTQNAVIKDARNIDYIREITEMIEGSKFILVVRDFSKTLLSRKKVDFSSRWGSLGNILVMSYQMESIRRSRFNSKVDNVLYVVKHEDIVSHNYPSFLKSLLSVDKVESINSSRELFSEKELRKHKSKNLGKIQTSINSTESLTKIESLLLSIFLYRSFIEYGYLESGKRKLSILGATASMFIYVTWPFYKRFSLYRDRRYFG
jgi:hypothetical protein